VTLDFPEFRPLWPWVGADLQTLRNTLAPPRVASGGFPAERVRLSLPDASGDVLLGLLQRPAPDAPRPLVLLLHGLGGCEDSVYMQRSAQHFVAAGHPVLRLNLRGAGPSRDVCRHQYHAGRSEDLRAALGALDPRWTGAGIVVIGFSLGGNLLLKGLGEWGSAAPLRAAVAVSAPLDLAASCRRIMAARNAVYHRYLLRRLRRQSHAATDARSLYEFDDRVVAARNGFAGADDYYARCSAAPFLDAIRVPTLLIHALDDPWIPAAAYTQRDWSRNPRVVPLLARGGGHVGFHARDARAAWHDRCAQRFIAALG
jgi:predicted alpha/beta-fold hydrolase